MRLVDKQAGRYTYTDAARTTNAVFLSDELLPATYTLHNSNTNAGGFAAMNFYTTLESTIVAKLPNELSSLLEPIDFITSTGGTSYSGTATCTGKLLLPAYSELFSNSTTQYQDETKNGGTTFGLYDYFADNTAASFKIRKRVDTAAATT